MKPIALEKIKLTDLVIINWVDATSTSEWVDLESEKEMNRLLALNSCHTCGWVLKKDEKSITLFASFSDDNGVSDATTIPTSWIENIYRLKYPSENVTPSKIKIIKDE